MRTTSLRSCLAAVGFSVCTLFLPTAAAKADEAARTIEITVPTGEAPKSALGILMSGDQAVQKPVAKVERAGDDHLIVTLPVKEGEIAKDGLATALVVTDSGEMVFGDIRPVFSAPAESYLRIPRCAPQKFNPNAVQGQISLIDSLVETRLERRRLAQVRVAQLMTDDLASKIQKLEERFGLQSTLPLSPDLPPVQLIERLSRLLAVIDAKNSRRTNDKDTEKITKVDKAEKASSSKSKKK